MVSYVSLHTVSALVDRFQATAERAAAKEKTSTTDLLKLVNYVKTADEKLTKAHRQAINDAGESLLNTLDKSNSKAYNKKSALISLAVGAAGGELTLHSIEKTIHTSDIKVLSASFAKISAWVNNVCSRLDDSKGQQLMTRDTFIAMYEPLRNLSSAITHAQGLLKATSYQHNASKSEALEKMQTAVKNLQDNLKDKLAGINKSAADGLRLAEQLTKALVDTKELKKWEAALFNNLVKDKGVNHQRCGG